MTGKTLLFVAGAGTDVGKTYVSAALLRLAAAARRPTLALKPVASGAPPLADPGFASTDMAILLRAQDLPVNEETVAACTALRFTAPLSPDMAAAAEGRDIDYQALCAWAARRIASAPADAFVLVEGVGGLMSPISERQTNLDFMEALNLPAILVSGSYLGAISHVLSAAECLRNRGAALRAVVLSESAGSPPPLDSTAETIRRFLPGVPLFVLQRGGGVQNLAPLIHP